MANFKKEVILIIDVEAEDEQLADRVVWTLLDKRIDGQQIEMKGSTAIVEDWKIDPQDEPLNAGAKDDSSGRGNRSGRGFASMDPEKRREIARKGGEHSHGGSNSDDDQLQAMEALLSSGKLDEKGRREVQDAINKRKSEVSQNSVQH